MVSGDGGVGEVGLTVWCGWWIVETRVWWKLVWGLNIRPHVKEFSKYVNTHLMQLDSFICFNLFHTHTIQVIKQ